MPSIITSSDLLEVSFTPEELNIAMQLQDKGLSIMYLQNTKVGLFRQLAAMEFADASQDQAQFRSHAFLKGQLAMLQALIDGAYEPTQVPLPPEQSPQEEAFSQRWESAPSSFTTTL